MGVENDDGTSSSKGVAANIIRLKSSDNLGAVAVTPSPRKSEGKASGSQKGSDFKCTEGMKVQSTVDAWRLGLVVQRTVDLRSYEEIGDMADSTLCADDSEALLGLVSSTQKSLAQSKLLAASVAKAAYNMKKHM